MNKLIIFNFEDVLVDMNSVYQECIMSSIRKVIGIPEHKIALTTKLHQPLFEQFAAIKTQLKLTDDQLTFITDQFGQDILRELFRGISATPGAEALMIELVKSYSLALVSSSPASLVINEANILSITPHFSEILSELDIRDNPSVYADLIKKTDVSPNDTLIVYANKNQLYDYPAGPTYLQVSNMLDTTLENIRKIFK